MATPSTPSIIAPPGRCTLPGLPSELRNRIWELVLPLDSTITVCGSLTRPRTLPPRGRKSLPPLLRVNNQIRRETLGMLFGSNTFVLQVGVLPHRYDRSRGWIQAVGSNLTMVRTIYVDTAVLYEIDLAEKTVTLVSGSSLATPRALSVDSEDNAEVAWAAAVVSRGKNTDRCFVIKAEYAENVLRRTEGCTTASVLELLREFHSMRSPPS